MQNLRTSAYLTADMDNSILDLIYLLNLPIYLNPNHDHLYIGVNKQDDIDRIFSYGSKTPHDVRVSVEVFLEILIDIASGMKVRRAFERQGYTY